MPSPSSCKKIISPALDALLKNTLTLFDLLELSETTSLVVQPELYKTFEVEGIPSWTSLYNSKISLVEFFSSFTSFLQNEAGNQSIEADSAQSLDIHAVVKEVIEKLKIADPSQQDFTVTFCKQLGVEQFLKVYVLKNILLFPAVFGENMIDVLSKAELGDRKAILKLIQFDKSLLGAEWSQLELRKAQLSGDVAYFEQIAKAIITAPLIADNKNMKLTLVLVMGWHLGLKKLTYLELFDYVTQDLKIYGGKDPDTLYRQTKRLRLMKDET